MKKIQKPVSVLLSLMMVVSLFSIVPFTASAAAVYSISDASDWNNFCNELAGGNTFAGVTVRLTEIIGSGLYPVSRSAGSSYNHPFSGTFDGNGKKLYFEGSAGNPAPFAFLVGTESAPVSVSNLNVITTTNASDSDVVAGLVSVTAGYAEVTNCDVTVNLTTSTGANNPTDLFTAGLSSIADTHLTVSDCSVSGTITTNGKYAAGLAGVSNGSADIKNCASSSRSTAPSAAKEDTAAWSVRSVKPAR